MIERGVAVYGALAHRYASAFSTDDPVIVFDATGASEALSDAARRHARNERFFVRLILKREQAARIDAVASNIFASLPSLDDRLVALEQACHGSLNVNNAPLAQLSVYSPAIVRLMRAVLRFADGLLVSSEAERRRLAVTLQTEPRAIHRCFPDPSIPTPGTDERVRDAVVIWAPHLAGEAALTFALALNEMRIPLILVSASAPPANTSATWLPEGSAAGALARARAIVDTSGEGAEASLALARWNVPLVCDIESGAQELLTDVRTFDRNRFTSLYEAVVAALGKRPSTLVPTSTATTPLKAIEPDSVPTDGPLVSIVLPTFDRPDMLREALLSIRAQTYRNLETIVVIDGGPKLDALAAEFSDMRFLHMRENRQPHSTNTAFAQTTGKYVAFLNDDDVFFPDHIARMVGALERSGAAVAHGDVLTSFLRQENGTWHVYGFDCTMTRTANIDAMLVNNAIGATSVVFKRDALEDGTMFEERVPLYRDYALWVRLASEHDFVHVERLTSSYTIRDGGAQQVSNQRYELGVKSYQAIYDQYPTKGRAHLERQRQGVLQAAAAGAMRLHPTPAAEIVPIPWPLDGI